MKALKSSELRQMKTEELETLRNERRRAIFDLRFQHYTGAKSDTAAMSVHRRDIARIETVLRERTLAVHGG